jgi:hypothetical protein
LRDAIDEHRQAGILFVSAAGNTSTSNVLLPVYPASYDLPNVISVGATNNDDRATRFTNAGETSVHLFAPGEDIYSTIPGNTYAWFSGSSMAAPHVTGVAALLKSQDPARDAIAIKNLILSSGDINIEVPFLGSITQKRLNAYKALSCSRDTVMARLQPQRPRLMLGKVPLRLSMLHITCARGGGILNVQVQPGSELITLKDDGSGPDPFARDGEYSGKWVPPSAGEYRLKFPDGDVVTVVVDPDLEAGFPVKTLRTGGTYWGGWALHTLVGNIDSDPDQEIVVTGLANGPLYAWKSNGTMVPGWPPERTHYYANYPAMGKLSNETDGLQVVSRQLDGTVAAYDGSGAVISGWPRSAGHVNNSGSFANSLTDLDGDGLDEVVFADIYGIHVLRPDGSSFPGWPQPLPAYSAGSVALADLDGDGSKELILVSLDWNSDRHLYAFHSNGTIVAGFPVLIGKESAYWPVVGDVDGDGKPEIVTAGIVSPNYEWVVSAKVFSNAGILKVQMVGDGTRQIWAGMPALADLDADGKLDIIVQTNTMLHVWRGNGTRLQGWPVIFPVPGDHASPVIGDVDGDGFPDVVAVSRGHLFVYNRRGVMHRRFPKYIQPLEAGSITPAIADIDLDGRNEIVVTADFWPGFSGEFDAVRVYDLGGPRHGPVLWGQLLGGPRHQGSTSGTIAEQPVLLVAKAGPGTGVVRSKVAGIDCGEDCSQNYRLMSKVTLSPIPDPDSTFAGWSGACTGTGACTLTMDGNKNVIATFAQALALRPSVPAKGEVAVPYDGNLAPEGGAAPYILSVKKGSLPPGLVLSSPNIVGTPTRPGLYIFLLRVTDQLGASVSKEFTIKILKAVAISTKALQRGRVGKSYKVVLELTGGKAPYVWSVVSGALPDGLTLDSARQRIIGTPTTPGVFSATFEVSDVLGGTTQKPFTLTIKP